MMKQAAEMCHGEREPRRSMVVFSKAWHHKAMEAATDFDRQTIVC